MAAVSSPPQAADEWVSFARQHALLGGPLPVMRQIARMPAAEQDLIDEFLIDAGVHGGTTGGQLLERLQREVLVRLLGRRAAGVDLSAALADGLLRMAKEWRGFGL